MARSIQTLDQKPGREWFANRPEWKDPLQKNIKKFLLKTGNDQ
jgi:hypothetical protein